MSSFVGHSLTAFTIYSCHKPQPSLWHRVLWLSWLVIVSLLPDLDHFVPWLHQSAHHEMRISHSFTFALFLPIITLIIFLLCGLRGQTLKIRMFQVICAAFSHPILDLFVGVVGIHLFWPFSWQIIRLPFGLLPSAGSLYLTNYYFYCVFYSLSPNSLNRIAIYANIHDHLGVTVLIKKWIVSLRVLTANFFMV